MFRYFFIILFYLSFLTTNSLSDKVNKIDVNGNDRISDETIIMFSSVSVNDDIDENSLNDILKNLYGTDFFKNVSVKFDKNILEIIVIENPLIENIKYNGIKSETIKSKFTQNLRLKSRSSYS